MHASCSKEGYLQKAGKHSFQAWRKRWFILNENELKYYTPGSQYNDSNLLGTIQMKEIQSLLPSKNTKHGLDIVTSNRTFSVAAKSDPERDEWIIMLRRACSKRSETSSVENPAYWELSPNEYAYVTVDERTKAKKSKKSKKDGAPQTSAAEYSVVEAYEDIDSLNKSRAETLPVMSDKTVKLKERSKSSTDPCQYKRANSMLRHMSSDEKNTEQLYQQIDEELGKTSDEDGDDGDDHDHDDEPSLEADECVFPEARDKFYAFDELKKALGSDLEQFRQKWSRDDVISKYGYAVRPDDEFPSLTLLRLHLERMK